MREYLYIWRPSEGEAITILVQPAEIPDGPPEGEEIAVAVRVILTGRVGGSLVMRSEHLRVRIREAAHEEDPDPQRWDKLVS